MQYAETHARVPTKGSLLKYNIQCGELSKLFISQINTACKPETVRDNNSAINISNFLADLEVYPCARAELLKQKLKGPHALAPPRCDRSRMRVRASPCTGDRTRSPSSRRLGYDFNLKISVFTFQMVHQGPAGPKVVPNPARLAGRGCSPPPAWPPHALLRRVRGRARRVLGALSCFLVVCSSPVLCAQFAVRPTF